MLTDKVSNLPILNLDSILPSSDGWLRLSTALLVGSLGILTGISTGLTFDQTVNAQGVIRPTEPYPVVTTPIAGTLNVLYVKENHRIVSDQVIGELSSNGYTEPLIALQDGIIFQLSDDLLGKSLSVGTPVASIAPIHPELVLKLHVDTQDIGQIAIGQSVQARVSAYPYPDYGTLKGYIDAIAPDVTACNTCVTPYGYVVDVALPQTYLERQETRHLLTPGMDVEATIVTQRTRLLSAILRKLRFATGV
ncbi:MAG: HlyD family efflux transporter periplasmic adaptor subunit [Symploca sp. SIO2G7]|nr:HlyD family efflux transporter periplasmic adaptor subunit [Symploca sp. SIO2G7]